MTLLAARAFGADCIAITDLVQRNLDLAKQLGADEALRIERDAAPDVIAAQLKQCVCPSNGCEQKAAVAVCCCECFAHGKMMATDTCLMQHITCNPPTCSHQALGPRRL